MLLIGNDSSGWTVSHFLQVRFIADSRFAGSCRLVADHSGDDGDDCNGCDDGGCSHVFPFSFVASCMLSIIHSYRPIASWIPSLFCRILKINRVPIRKKIIKKACYFDTHAKMAGCFARQAAWVS